MTNNNKATVDQRGFDSILIANRGEIACRVIRTARRLGYRTVAVYSEPDASSVHISLADEAVALRGASSTETYLDIEQIIAACKVSGAGAVHPGYGFLAENTAFAAACDSAGITFIGPPAAAIELMGSKRLSKIAMLEAGVPCVSGYEAEAQDDDSLRRAAHDIGFPLMIKATAGGGGRGMRLVSDASEFMTQLKTARSEALNAFGSDEVILERAIIEPRHIEIQIMADRHGHCIHLGERDCSIQRRHQKVVEEAPSPVMTESLRVQMGDAAVKAAERCSYVGAGTVEFLLDRSGEFYFLEMNTRLQVEHPVTEMICGLDLVALQIDMAAGKPLSLQQSDVVLQGHAIEVRVYAEDPAQDFLPQTGPIIRWQHGGHTVDEAGLTTSTESAMGRPLQGLRVDDGCASGQSISPYYDSMLAKIIGYGQDRETARRQLVNGLEGMTFFGPTANLGFLGGILRNDAFIRGQATTAFLQEQHGSLLISDPEPQNAVMLAALILYLVSDRKTDDSRTAAWRHSAFGSALAAPAPATILLSSSTAGPAIKPASVSVRQRLNADTLVYETSCAGASLSLEIIELNDNDIVILQDRRRLRLGFALHGPEDSRTVFLKVTSHGRSWHHVFADCGRQRGRSDSIAGDGRILATMDGLLIDVHAEPGAKVAQGDLLFTLEAMKIEHPIKANASGRLKSVKVSAGQQVKGRQLLAEIETVQPDSSIAAVRRQDGRYLPLERREYLDHRGRKRD